MLGYVITDMDANDATDYEAIDQENTAGKGIHEIEITT